MHVIQSQIWKRLFQRKPRQLRLGCGLLVLSAAVRLSAETASEWMGAAGNWNDTAHWSRGLPFRPSQVTINGTEQAPAIVTVDQADVLVSHIAVGEANGSLASLTLNGPALTVIGTMDIGKYTGSSGQFIMNSGSVFAGTFFLSG